MLTRITAEANLITASVRDRKAKVPKRWWPERRPRSTEDKTAVNQTGEKMTRGQILSVLKVRVKSGEAATHKILKTKKMRVDLPLTNRQNLWVSARI